MEAANAGRIVALTNQIQIIQQVLEIIDAGGKITAMTLQAPTPETPEQPAVPQPVEPPEVVEGEEPSDEPTTLATPDAEPAEPQGVDPPALTISTEDLQYPPQMLQSIRQQELEMWQASYDELEKLGVTDVPKPPSDEGSGPPPAAPITERRAGPTPPPVTGRVGGPPPRSPGRRR